MAFYRRGAADQQLCLVAHPAVGVVILASSSAERRGLVFAVVVHQQREKNPVSPGRAGTALAVRALPGGVGFLSLCVPPFSPFGGLWGEAGRRERERGLIPADRSSSHPIQGRFARVGTLGELFLDRCSGCSWRRGLASLVFRGCR